MGLIFSAKCVSATRLDGKTAIITGANTGIGKETAKDFYRRGATVILACRNLEKAKDAVTDIKKQCDVELNVGQLKVVELDLCRLASVRACAKEILENEEQIHLLINNAGVMMSPYSKTEDGFEVQFGTNHLGHFLLTLLLLPKICRSTPARIVIVSSIVHITNHITGVNVYALHPGIISTELSRHFSSIVPGLTWIYENIFGFFLKKPIQGAQTQIYCAVSDKCANETGLYYAECTAAWCSRQARDAESARKLWDMSMELVGINKNQNLFN